MSEHTPGPWGFVGPSPGVTADDDGGDYAIYQDGHIIAEVFHHVYWERSVDAEANARLIAAAPDLLAACEAVLADHEESLSWGEFGLTDEALEQVKQAIAKAKGESSD